MYTQVEKTKENKSRATANSAVQKKNNVKQSVGFVDNRPEAIAQRKLQVAINNYHQIKQLKKPTEGQLERIPELEDRIPVALNYYRTRKEEIIEIVDSEYGWSMEDVKEVFFDEYETFFRKLPMIPDRARESQASFKRLLRQLALWYDSLKDKLDKKFTELNEIHTARENEDEELTENERDDLVDITPADERYFQWYLKKSKPAKQVYRGDGRGVKAGFLDDFKFESILPGGSPDISFYGVVQHTHSSVNKNGMVSTTTDRAQALSWATDDHNHGVVYEMEVTNYINVAELLAARNFKDRFAAQLEILIPSKIMAGEVKRVVLYSNAGEIGKKNNG